MKTFDIIQMIFISRNERNNIRQIHFLDKNTCDKKIKECHENINLLLKNKHKVQINFIGNIIEKEIKEWKELEFDLRTSMELMDDIIDLLKLRKIGE